MESLIFKKGIESNLPKSLDLNTFYVTTDSKKIHLNDAIWEDTNQVLTSANTYTDNSINVLSEHITENEKVTANALIDLEEKINEISGVTINELKEIVENFFDENAEINETIDTLKEIQDYIDKHGTKAKAMLSAITKNEKSIEIISGQVLTNQEELINLRTYVEELENQVDENEEVTANSLVDLEDKITSINEKVNINTETTLQSIVDVETKINSLNEDVVFKEELNIFKQIITENEKVTANSLVDLKNDITSLTEQVNGIEIPSPSIEVIWGNESNLNDYITVGTYNIIGERINPNDNMPILNYSPGHSIHGQLIVLDSSISDSSKDDDKCISQKLFLSNRTGGGTNVYVRTARGKSLESLTWNTWEKLQSNIEVGQVFSLNSYIDNGIYSGVYTNGTTFAETFVMVVINNYAVAHSFGVTRSISQFKYSLNVGGSITYQTRVGHGDNSDNISWEEWTHLVTSNDLIELNEHINLTNTNVNNLTNIVNENEKVTSTTFHKLNNNINSITESINNINTEVNNLSNIVAENEEVIAKTIEELSDSIEKVATLSKYNALYPIIEHNNSSETFELTPNTFHIWGEVDNLTLTLGEGINGYLNEYFFQFTSNDTTILSLPNDIKWIEMPIMADNKIHQISIINNLATVLSFDI